MLCASAGRAAVRDGGALAGMLELLRSAPSAVPQPAAAEQACPEHTRCVQQVGAAQLADLPPAQGGDGHQHPVAPSLIRRCSHPPTSTWAPSLGRAHWLLVG